MYSWTIRARVVSWICQPLAMTIMTISMNMYLRWVHLSAHQGKSRCSSGQGHRQRGTTQPKYLQKNASWLEIDSKCIVDVQIQLPPRSSTYLFIHVVPISPMPYPSSFPRCTWQHYGASVKPRVDGDAKGPIAQRQHAWKKSNSPHHSNDGPDDPIAPYRPLLHRTNLHANPPPLAAISSATRA